MIAINGSSCSAGALPPGVAAAIAMTSPHDRFLHSQPTDSSPGTTCCCALTGKANDAANNPNTASTSTDNTVTFDTQPTVTINQATTQTDPALTSPIHFTVVFSKPVTGFTNSGVTLSGTANPTTDAVSNPSNDSITFDVAVSGMSNDGTVIANVNEQHQHS